MLTVPESLEGWCLLHQMFTVSWPDLAQAGADDRAELAASLRGWLEASATADGSSIAVAMLGHKADLMLVHARRSFDDLVQAQLDVARLPLAEPWAVLYFGLGAALIMGFIGIMAGLWSEKFDHMAAVTNFVIMPMTFLSGTFYLVERLPEPFRTASYFNPFFYLIDGFRYGFVGQAESNLAVGVVMTAALTVFTGWVCFRMFLTGYKIKT